MVLGLQCECTDLFINVPISSFLLSLVLFTLPEFSARYLHTFLELLPVFLLTKNCDLQSC